MKQYKMISTGVEYAFNEKMDIEVKAGWTPIPASYNVSGDHYAHVFSILMVKETPSIAPEKAIEKAQTIIAASLEEVYG